MPSRKTSKRKVTKPRGKGYVGKTAGSVVSGTKSVVNWTSDRVTDVGSLFGSKKGSSKKRTSKRKAVKKSKGYVGKTTGAVLKGTKNTVNWTGNRVKDTTHLLSKSYKVAKPRRTIRKKK